MARCKDCIHYNVCAREGRMVQIDEHTWDYYNEIDNVERFCNNYVAPKSEVEKLEQAVKYLEGVCESTPDKVRAEVAREIFEEIEEVMLNNHCLDLDSDYPMPHYYEELQDDIAELKKKYTEEQNNEN